MGEAATVLDEVVALGGEFVELHAARDSAAAPVIARIAIRSSRGELTDINVAPIMSWSRRWDLPDGAVHSVYHKAGRRFMMRMACSL